jgi:hypothetical protein
MVIQMQQASRGTAAEDLLDGLFGKKRRLYKQLAEYSYFQNRTLYLQLARKPYPWLIACADRFADLAGQQLGERVACHEVLLDAPPVRREVEFRVDVCFPKESCYRSLEEVSPVVQTLARRQFDDYVKRVRVFIHPRLASLVGRDVACDQLLSEAIQQTP